MLNRKLKYLEKLADNSQVVKESLISKFFLAKILLAIRNTHALSSLEFSFPFRAENAECRSSLDKSFAWIKKMLVIHKQYIIVKIQDFLWAMLP